MDEWYRSLRQIRSQANVNDETGSFAWRFNHMHTTNKPENVS